MYEELKALLKIKCSKCDTEIKMSDDVWNRVQKIFDAIALEAISENGKHDS